MTSDEQGSFEAHLREAEKAKTGHYDKRTEHLREDGTAVFINRLVLEDSPYLLQHAHNPVNWYPWGAEAFETAKRENKPLFLSIGYSTCHWCHVMEVESFDNVEVAKLLNQSFISVKMDREQYPDIDDFYMTGVQIMTGHGGWPMSNFLLADGKPFFGATYFPPAKFIELLEQIVAAWRDKNEELVTSANSIHAAIDRLLNTEKQQQAVAGNARDDVLKALLQREDRSLGGLAGAPKFPQEPLLLLLLDQLIRERDSAAYGFLKRALTGMGLGGIHDQVGGGFHRYSVDEEWLVPHFEKMLYNQSQLGLIYTDAYRLTGESFYKRIATRLFDYVLRDMQIGEGGFYSATDADSEGEEGTFFLWTPEQLQQVLGEEAQLVIDVFKVTQFGNFEGATILNLDKPLEDHVATNGADVVERVDGSLQHLYEAREHRVHPLRDDKLIVAWCAHMATALIHASFVMERPDWLQAAQRAIRTMLTRNLDDGGQLQRIYLNGQVSIAAQLEDYGNLIEALIALFDVSGDLQCLQQASALAETMLESFYDESQACMYLGPAQQAGPKLVRSTNAADGATLSAVGTVLASLWKLGQRSALLDDALVGKRYPQIVRSVMSTLATDINSNAISHSSLLRMFAVVEAGSRDPIQYAGQGAVRVIVQKRLGTDATIFLNIQCAESWHVTAAGARNEQLVPIKLEIAPDETVWKLGEVEYPAPHEELNLLPDGSDEALTSPIYKEAFEIKASLIAPLAGDELADGVRIQLRLQLCSDERCLLPETLQFVI
ncbi:MAG: thioredoxin domain-containing protein [Pseudomonadales bacterium]|nr:thioredoxin domain-containing protein [Pseudomonadales bacterium]